MIRRYEMIDGMRMAKLAANFTISLSEIQLQQFKKYAELLLEWNQKINLTAITQPEEIEIKHFIDSLLLAASDKVEGKLVDVGSGAGFPGIVTKIYKPDLDVCLMEPTGKRVKFLQEVCNKLHLQAEIVKERAEEAARKSWREQFDVATARAVAPLSILCEYCLPLVKIGGWFIAMKGEDQMEIEQANGAIEKLGARLADIHRFTLPDQSKRTLIFIEKVKNTPSVYPRNGGVIAKRPLK